MKLPRIFTSKLCKINYGILVLGLLFSHSAYSQKKLTELSYGNGLWVLVMSGGTDFSLQSWITKSTFPTEEIKELWDQDYYITNVSYGNGQCAFVLSKNSGYSSQSYTTNKFFPSNSVSEKLNEGYSITDLSFGDGLWVVVFTKGSSNKSIQIYKTNTEFPSTEIRDLWDKGYFITSLAYEWLTWNEGFWALVMSKNCGIVGQTYNSTNFFPSEWISAKWNEGFAISNVIFGDDKWNVVMSKGLGITGQTWNTRSDFPQKEIADGWNSSESLKQSAIPKTYDVKKYLDFEKYAFIIKAYKSLSGNFIPISENENIVIDVQKKTFTHIQLDEKKMSIQEISDLKFDYENQIFRANVVQRNEISHEIELRQDQSTFFIVTIKHLKSNSTTTYRLQVGEIL